MLHTENVHSTDMINILAYSEHFKDKMQQTDSDFTILQCKFV